MKGGKRMAKLQRSANIQAKGINFTGVKKYVEMNYGEEMWLQLIKSLSPETQAVWVDNHAAGAAYPFSAFKEMISALHSLLKATSESEAAAVYEFIVDQSVSSMGKIYHRMTQPSQVVRNYPQLWSKFFNAGTVQVPVATRGRGVVRFLLPEIFDDMLPAACLGYSRKAVEMGGGKDLRMERTAYQKKNDGLFESVYELRWVE
jgi:hypothetical protein